MWSIVLGAKAGSSQQAEEAIAKLCQIYWHPVYAFLRRSGRNCHDAQDLTQGFFEHLLAKGSFRSVEREKGRFRNFLLASLDNFLCNAWNKEHAKKRGSMQLLISWDELNETESSDLVPFHDVSPPMAFDRTWAASIIKRVLESLRVEYSRLGKTGLFEILSTFLPGGTVTLSHEIAADKLSMTRAAFDVALHRFRTRFGNALRGEVSQTVSSPAEIDEEIRYLVSAWTAGN